MAEIPKTSDAVLELVRKSTLVEEGDLSTFLFETGQLPPAASDTATLLVHAGILTAFQAKLILQGRYKGFRIGTYRILDLLGSGGMGQVFLAEHIAMRRRVALKVLPAKLALDPVGVERFYREARAAAALNHPNIIRAHDVGTDRGTHYLVLEYADGMSLADIVRKAGGKLAPATAVAYTLQAASGLAHAHSRGIVHRDIKPQNMLIDHEGVLKILDMGLARFFAEPNDELTKKHAPGAVMGTADYISPEQLMGADAIDHRADIYSLGASLYHMVTGQPPYPGNTSVKLLSHTLKVAKPACELAADVSGELSAVIARMMAKDPNDRYPTVEAAAGALLPFAQGATTQLLESHTAGNTIAVASANHAALRIRKRLCAGVGVLLVVLVACGIGYFAFYTAKPPTDRTETAGSKASLDAPKDDGNPANTNSILQPPISNLTPLAPSDAISPGPAQLTLAYRLPVNERAVECMIFTPDGKWVITAGTEGVPARLVFRNRQAPARATRPLGSGAGPGRNPRQDETAFSERGSHRQTLGLRGWIDAPYFSRARDIR